VRDARLEKFAKVLVHYCLGAEKGDTVLIRGETVAAPLIHEVYAEALRAGAHPMLRLALPGMHETFYNTAKKHQLTYQSPFAQYEIEHIDKLMSIRATENTMGLSSVDPKVQAVARKSQTKWMQTFRDRSAAGDLRWSLTQFPCSAHAQSAEMSLSDYEDFVFRACMLHKKDPVAAWRSVHRKQAKMCKLLDGRKTLRIVREGTDVTMSIEGRTWINSDGRTNMPSGEVFTGPVEDSVEGKVRYSFPAIWGGHEVHGIELTFKEGKVVKATAEKGEEFLHATLDTDEGARFVGEVAVGTNYNIQQFTKNILFDEKIGGTVHIAVGASYPQTGGRNTSSVHWDMITDMRDGGRIYADGKLVYKDGQFILG